MASNPLAVMLAAKLAGNNAVSFETATKRLERLPFYQEALINDLARLKTLATIDEKNAAKVTMLDKYIVFVDEYVSNGHNYRNPVAVQVMIWLFDVGSIERALKLAFVLVDQKQFMPNGFGRDMPTFISDAIYDWGNKLWKEKKSASPYLDQVVEKLADWSERFDLHPAVVSKLYVMLAKHKNEEGDYQAVIYLCNQAEAANPDGHGSKTLKKTAQNILKSA